MNALSLKSINLNCDPFYLKVDRSLMCPLLGQEYNNCFKLWYIDKTTEPEATLLHLPTEIFPNTEAPALTKLHLQF